ncbi:hypothetical protein DAMA08_005050 [Martiniozyma asiatica (nom. inval.)]|nr:hypothetical protein DAMA08_005050 [Martiniozyma asiatica]
MSFDNNIEGYNACQRMWYTWWNNNVGHFTTQIPCHEAHGSQYSCYAQSVAIQAIGDSAMIYKDLTMPIVEPAVKSCLKYRNPSRRAYSVDFHGGINSGDDDICYDDNAHLLRGLLACYKGTKLENILTMCKEIMAFLMTGVVTHQQWGVQGLKWHVSKKYMATISNSVAAICAMEMIPYANSDNEKQQLYQFARLCLNFIWSKMIDNDNCVMDGVGMDSDVIDRNKYTYNQGMTLKAVCLVWQYDQDKEWIEKAKKLAEAATDRGRTLFDRDYPDYSKRYWHGSTYFGQLLIEGLADYVKIMGHLAPESTAQACKNEIKRHLSYMKKYVEGKNDQLYFMSFDIYSLDENIYKRYQNEFGGSKPFKPNPIERQSGLDKSPIENRPVVKSLMGQAAASHMFFAGASILPKMDPDEV